MQSVVEGDKLRIKVACTKDTATLGRLGKQTFIETYASFNSKKNLQKYIKAHFSKKSTLSQLEDDHNFFLVARLHDKDCWLCQAEGKQPAFSR